MSAPYAALFETAHATVREEHDGPLEIVEGAIPPELRGVLYRNGPGRLERGGHVYGHLFDGDGMICRYAFEGGAVRYRNRFVRTREYLDEEQADQIRYRNFGTNLPGGMLANIGRLRFKNAANTHVMLSVRPSG